jgi:hypothetical protein
MTGFSAWALYDAGHTLLGLILAAIVVLHYFRWLKRPKRQGHALGPDPDRHLGLAAICPAEIGDSSECLSPHGFTPQHPYSTQKGWAVFVTQGRQIDLGFEKVKIEIVDAF